MHSIIEYSIGLKEPYLCFDKLLWLKVDLGIFALREYQFKLQIPKFPISSKNKQKQKYKYKQDG